MAAGRRVRVLTSGAAVSAVAVVAAWVALHTTTPATANFFVDANGGTCTRQATPGAYSDAGACASMDAAYQLASAGDRVVVKSHDYGSVKFHQRATPMTSPGVTFYVEPGTTFATINFGCESQSNGCLPVAEESVEWITLTGDKGAWDASFLYFAHATDITVDGVTIDRAWQTGKAVFWAGSTLRTTVRNANICCNLNTPLMESFIGTGAATANEDITLEDTRLGPIRRDSEGVHNECFLATAVPGLTLTRTVWTGCNVMNINIGAFGFATAFAQERFTFTNNIFESPTDLNEFDKTYFPWFQGCSAPDYTQLADSVFAYNFFESPFYGCGGFNGLTLRGNAGNIGTTGCPPNVVFIHNVWSSGACGATDTAAPDLITNQAAYFGGISTHEWWYKAGSPLLEAGDPGSYPATDIDGVSRPQGSLPDAGPHERRP